MAYKLQHWMVRVEYIPGENNTFADALLREECPKPDSQPPGMMPEDPGISLASGDVEGTPLHEEK